MKRREAILGILTLPWLKPVIKSLPKPGIGNKQIPIVFPTKEFIPPGPGLWQQIPKENMLPYKQVTEEMVRKCFEE